MKKFHRGNLPSYSSGLTETTGYLSAPKISMMMVVVIIITIIVIVVVVMVMFIIKDCRYFSFLK
jgi:hypothetical protein